MILLDDYLNHWRVNYPDAEVPDDELTDDMRADAAITVDRANQLLTEFGEERGVSSGWRPQAVNRLVRRAAIRSNHCVCRAIDIADPGGKLDGWLNDDPTVLDELDLWRESPSATPGWLHVQIVPYGSWQPGKSRTYKP